MKQRLVIMMFLAAMVGLGAGLYLTNVWWGDKENEIVTERIEKPPLPDPEISGWVAWWKEEPAYDLVSTQSGLIKTVLPVWWLVDENLRIKNVGKVDREAVVARMKAIGVSVYPTLGSELTGKKLSPLFEGNGADELISIIVSESSRLGVAGLDIDLEGIDGEDREKFVQFLARMKTAAYGVGLKLSVTIQAQDGKNFWFGAAGQDIAKIGEIADEVRIMTYDRHSKSSSPGAIAPLDWIAEVARYNLKLILREKIVMGIPSYGYLWPKVGAASGLQWDEFEAEIAEREYNGQRNKLSGEMQFTSSDFSAWLSDGLAMKVKIDHFRDLGLNKFVIWHLGGMDAAFFDSTWKPD